MMSRRYFAVSLALVMVVSLTPCAWAGASQAARIQAALESWLTKRAPAEKVTGVSAYVSFGDPGPAIEAFAGKVGSSPRDPPIRQNTLFQMGSTSKSFVAAVILQLEAAGRLSMEDKVGKWLPQYPAWKAVSIRRLLNMTSGIPNYSETEVISHGWANDPAREWTAAELVRIVYPTAANPLPATTGYHYSNTNYVLASMIAEKVTGRSYRALVQERVIDAFGLDSMFYEPGAYPAAVTARLAHGYFDNPACADFQPDCSRSWNLPLMGKDVRAVSTSWAQAAGGAIANARDVDRWMRAVFEGHVVPARQQAEWMALVSNRTGEPIADVSAGNPRGFALGLGKAVLGPIGAHWFYQGETLGYRTLYVWFGSENLMITLQTNSQPAADQDRLHDLLGTIHQIVEPALK